MSTWWWPWSTAPPKPRTPTDAAGDPALRAHFTHLLDHCEPPETFRPREVAELLNDTELSNLGYEKAEEALPAIYELAFELREFGHCVIIRKGKILPDDVSLAEIDGPIRIMRNADL